MSKASLAHHYEDPRDAVTAPHRFMALTHYYVDRWLPELGERGHAIVTVLRRMGYLDRERDIERGGIEIEQDELAALCGLSLRTLQREFAGAVDGRPNNPALHLFVQREKQYHRNGVGRIVREKTVYVIQMKDPLHPGDEDALREEHERREKGRSRQVGGNEDPRSRQVGGNEDPRTRQVGGTPRQADARSRQVGGTPRQLGGNPKGVLDSYRPKNTSDTPAAPGGSLSLFDGKEEQEGGPSAEESEALRAAWEPASQPKRPVTLKQVEEEWQAMTEAGKGRFRAEAMRQLQEQGQAKPPDRMVEPLMFKLFWVERKGLVPAPCHNNSVAL